MFHSQSVLSSYFFIINLLHVVSDCFLLIVCGIGLVFKRGFVMSLLRQRESDMHFNANTLSVTVKPCGRGWEDGVHPWEEG